MAIDTQGSASVPELGEVMADIGLDLLADGHVASGMSWLRAARSGYATGRMPRGYGAGSAADTRYGHGRSRSSDRLP